MTDLAVRELSKSFGRTRALDGVSLEVADGEFFVILGPTNAGKSTLLKTIAGLLRPEAGSVHIGGRPANDLPPRERGVSLLFQNIALFPNMNGFDNIAFPLRAAGNDESAVRERVQEVAATLKVEHLLQRPPRTFSGGEQQRVAIGRAIAQPCDLLLLDEPLSNLDARIRIALRLEFKKLHTERRQTIVYVTHDQVEAMSLSSRVGVLDHGRFHQVAPPDEIYQRPANRFVAGFVGMPPMNILEAELHSANGRCTLSGPGYRVDAPGLVEMAREKLPERLGYGVRAEEIVVAPGASPQAPVAAEIGWIEHLGARRVLDLRVDGSVIKAVVPRSYAAASGDVAWFGFAPKPFRLLDRDSGRFLREPPAR